MSAEQIVVRVASDGQVHAETKGIKGPKCLDSIQLLEDLLEAQSISSSFTHEYNESANLSTIEDVNDLRQR